MGQHIESLFTALHAEPAAWTDTLCTQGGLRKWLGQDKKGPVQAYVTEVMREDFIMRMRRDGFTASLCYYRALVTGLMYEQDKELPVERYKVNVLYVFVAGMLDVVYRPQGIERAMALGLTPNLTMKEVDVGHCCMLAKPKEIGGIFVKWLGDTY